MPSLPVRMKKIQSKMKSLEWPQHFSHYLSRRSRAGNSAVPGRFWLNLKLIRDIIIVLVTCKNEEDPIKNGILPKFDLIQTFMHVLDTCNNEEDRFKDEGARLATIFLPLKVYEDFSRRSRAANSAVRDWIWPNFEFIRDFMVVLVTY